MREGDSWQCRLVPSMGTPLALIAVQARAGGNWSAGGVPVARFEVERVGEGWDVATDEGFVGGMSTAS